MNKKNLEILGLGENATVDEIKTAYENLRERYLEERFKDGEVGNNAARMLTRIETAYNDLMSEIGEASRRNAFSIPLTKGVRSGTICRALFFTAKTG